MLWYYRTKNAFPGYKKSRKINISPQHLIHGFGQKLAIFFIFFFKSNIGQENVVYDILERENAFLWNAVEKDVSWSLRVQKLPERRVFDKFNQVLGVAISDFSKGVNPSFGGEIGKSLIDGFCSKSSRENFLAILKC